ncbi:hypothetical protein Q4E40_05490 [Pontibacter sp. BT731]|uniref:hypothetical protein n=1 Tax=Pontibacter coccineus TaxID=3063328 RepID=UPI0026E45199|nr:hypothetical protein [Pontibacter sp. BT731]MDO6389569.1 hypothetical protein [Pontibacter sp. BT731]
MKRALIYLFLGFCIMILSTYTMGIFDDALERTYYTGVWYKDIIGSFKYYIFWVLPYWWVIIVGGAIFLALIFYGIVTGIEKAKSLNQGS